MGGNQLIDEAHGLRRGRAQHAARQHRGHGVDGTGELDRAHRAVEAWEDAELHLGEAEARALLAVGDAIVAGKRKFEPAAEAETMDGGDDGDRQLLDAVEQPKRLLHHLLDLSLGGEAREFADIGADAGSRTAWRSSARGP